MSNTRWSLMFLANFFFSTAFAPRATGPEREIAVGPTTDRSAATEVVVAAAADLKFAMDSIVAVFTAKNPSITVKPVYGSSGSFFEQINNGAPFDLFFSAEAAHQPLQQGFVLLPHAKDNAAAAQFATFFGTPTVSAILKSFGFAQP